MGAPKDGGAQQPMLEGDVEDAEDAEDYDYDYDADDADDGEDAEDDAADAEAEQPMLEAEGAEGTAAEQPMLEAEAENASGQQPHEGDTENAAEEEADAANASAQPPAPNTDAENAKVEAPVAPKLPKPPRRTRRAPSKKIEFTFDQDVDALSLSEWVFDMFDADGSGYLEENEMQRVLEVMLCSYCCESTSSGPCSTDLAHMLQLMLKSVDFNQDGRIDSMEWSEFSRSVYEITGRQRFISLARGWAEVLERRQQEFLPETSAPSSLPGNFGPTVPKLIRQGLIGVSAHNVPSTRDQVAERIDRLTSTLPPLSHLLTHSIAEKRAETRAIFGRSLRCGRRKSSSFATEIAWRDDVALRERPKNTQRLIPIGSHALPATATKFKQRSKNALKLQARVLHLQQTPLPTPKPGQATIENSTCESRRIRQDSFVDSMDFLGMSGFSVLSKGTDDVTVDDLPAFSVRSRVGSACSSAATPPPVGAARLSQQGSATLDPQRLSSYSGVDKDLRRFPRDYSKDSSDIDEDDLLAASRHRNSGRGKGGSKVDVSRASPLTAAPTEVSLVEADNRKLLEEIEKLTAKHRDAQRRASGSATSAHDQAAHTDADMRSNSENSGFASPLPTTQEEASGSSARAPVTAPTPPEHMSARQKRQAAFEAAAAALEEAAEEAAHAAQDDLDALAAEAVELDPAAALMAALEAENEWEAEQAEHAAEGEPDRQKDARQDGRKTTKQQDADWMTAMLADDEDDEEEDPAAAMMAEMYADQAVEDEQVDPAAAMMAEMDTESEGETEQDEQVDPAAAMMAEMDAESEGESEQDG